MKLSQNFQFLFQKDSSRWWENKKLLRFSANINRRISNKFRFRHIVLFLRLHNILHDRGLQLVDRSREIQRNTKNKSNFDNSTKQLLQRAKNKLTKYERS